MITAKSQDSSPLGEFSRPYVVYPRGEFSFPDLGRVVPLPHLASMASRGVRLLKGTYDYVTFHQDTMWFIHKGIAFHYRQTEKLPLSFMLDSEQLAVLASPLFQADWVYTSGILVNYMEDGSCVTMKPQPPMSRFPSDYLPPDHALINLPPISPSLLTSVCKFFHTSSTVTFDNHTVSGSPDEGTLTFPDALPSMSLSPADLSRVLMAAPAVKDWNVLVYNGKIVFTCVGQNLQYTALL